MIQKTGFESFPEKIRTFGYVIYDDFGSDFCDTLEEADLRLADVNFLTMVRSSGKSDTVTDLLSAAQRAGGICINGSWINWPCPKEQ